MILKPKEEKDTWLVARVKRIYQPLLHKELARKRLVMISALVALLGSFALFPFLGKEFMPQMQEGSIMWRVTGIPYTPLNESIRHSNEIAGAVKQLPEVKAEARQGGKEGVSTGK